MDFLDLVLPPLRDGRDGLFGTTAAYFAVGILEGKVLVRPCGDHGTLVDACMEFSSKGYNSYFAQAAFTDASRGRTQANVQSLRCFWLDIDVGKKANSYATRREALEAIVAFSRKLPPTFIVSSGVGFYVYYCVDECLEPDRWLTAARSFEAYVKAEGLVADPACTCDSARILRLPGTRHVKSGNTAEIVYRRDEPWELTSLLGYFPEISAAPAPFRRDSPFDSAPMYKAEVIVRNCPAVRAAGISVEPAWYAMMSVMRRCVDGREWAHRISATDPARYDTGKTDAKFDHAPADSPATCATFERADPRWCQHCEYRGRVKSPANLPRVAQATPILAQAPPPPESVVEDGVERLVLPEEFEHPMVGLDTPKFTVTDRGVVMHKVEKDPAGNLRTVDHTITTSRIYYIKSTKEQVSRTAVLRAHWFKTLKANGAPGPTGAIFAKDLASPAAAYTALAEMDVLSADFAAYGNTVFQKFMNTYINAILANGSVNEIPIVDEFGWSGWKDELGVKQPAFSIGGGLLTAAGLRPQDYSGLALELSKALRPKGTLEEWKAIPRMYTELDQRLGEFCFCMGFAAPLMAYGSGAAKNATFSLWSPGSGLGKTQLLRGVATIWGDPDDQFSKRDSSVVRKQRQLAVLHNLPAFMDELTDRTDDELYSLAFDLVSGQEKQKLSRDGRNVVETGTWNTITFITANRSIKEAAARVAGDSAAAIVRIMEMECDFRSFADDPPKQAMINERVLACSLHHGLAGPDFIWQLLNHPGHLKSLSSMVDHWVVSHGFSNEERFMANPIAIALRAGRWAVQWGLLEFDMDRLEKWVVDVFVPANRKSTDVFRADAAELLLDYLMLKQRNLLVVQSDTRKGPQPPPDSRLDPYVVMGPAHNDIYMRFAVEEKLLYVSVSDFRKWCEKRSFSPDNIMKSLANQGFAPKRASRCLSLGTRQYTTPVVSCYLFCGEDLDRLGYDMESLTARWKFQMETMKVEPRRPS